MKFKVVCVFVFQGLLAQAFPTTNDALEPVLVEGVAEFSGIVPASGSVTILGNFGCPPSLPTNTPFVTNPESFIARDKYQLLDINKSRESNVQDINTGHLFATSNPPVLLKVEPFIVNDDCTPRDYNPYSLPKSEISNDDDLHIYNTDPSPYFKNNNMDQLDKKVLFGSIIADTITEGNEAEIQAKLTEIDSFVDLALEKTGSIVNTVLKSAAVPILDALIHSDMSEVESQVAIVEAIAESELLKTNAIVKSVLENKTTLNELEVAAKELLTDFSTDQSDPQMSKQEEIDVELTEIDSKIESAVDIIDSFVESELEKVDSFIESELAKIDSFVETKLAITQALIDAELSVINLEVDSGLDEIAAVRETEAILYENPEVLMPVQGVAEFSGIVPATGSVLLYGNTGSSSTFDDSDFMSGTEMMFDNDRAAEADYIQNYYIPDTTVMGEMSFRGVVPATGRVQIVGSCGCPPLFPLNPPVVGNAESLIQNHGFSLHDNAYSMLARGVNNAPIFYHTDGALFQVDDLPIVNLNRNIGDSKIYNFDESEAIVERNLEFGGAARATGSTTVFAQFGCAPLLPTEETPDGKKYIWLSKRPKNSVIPSPPRQPIHHRSSFPILSYPSEFPETVIMDSTKNYERFTGDHPDLSVSGDVFFEGVVPAFGSVSLTGHC